MPIEPDATMIAIDRAFDDGRESLADDLQDFISNYDEEDGIPVQDIEEFLDLMLGYEPPEPTTFVELTEMEIYEALSSVRGGDNLDQ